ncbi:MAG: ribonuclease HII [bacterium]
MSKARRTLPLTYERMVWERGIDHIAGVDEAGRGPLAGPVVAAAVILPHELTLEGVDDSKKLSPKRREELFEAISESALSVGIGIVSHKIIDRINILQATVAAMKEAIANLRLPPQFILADGNSFSHETIQYENIIHGDARCHSIAAASIIAKVTRDRLMCGYDIEYPRYGFAQHKGYGTRQHVEAIHTLGFCAIHRRSFHLPEWPQRRQTKANKF